MSVCPCPRQECAGDAAALDSYMARHLAKCRRLDDLTDLIRMAGNLTDSAALEIASVVLARYEIEALS